MKIIPPTIIKININDSNNSENSLSSLKVAPIKAPAKPINSEIEKFKVNDL